MLFARSTTTISTSLTATFPYTSAGKMYSEYSVPATQAAELPCAGKPAEAANEAVPSTKAGATTLFVAMIISGFTIVNATPLA